MRAFVALAAVLQVAFGGLVSIRLPYENPAGVTYLHGANYNEGFSHLQYASPAIPARIETQHVGYAAAQVPAVAAVPYVKHIPTVSQVPVTTYEHQPAVIEKQVDVLKPAVSTRKIEVRRPAIQKQFYDIEERVIIRPAGSALIELKEPSSQLQKGPAFVQPLEQQGIQIPILSNEYRPLAQAPLHYSSSTPAPFVSSTIAPLVEDDGISIDNPEFRNVQDAGSVYSQQQLVGLRQQQLLHQQGLQEQQQFQQQQLQQIQEQQFQQQQLQLRGIQEQQEQQLKQIGIQEEQRKLNVEGFGQFGQSRLIQGEQLQQLKQNGRFIQNVIPQVESRSNGAAPLNDIARISSQEQGPALIPAVHRTSEENLANQKKLIDLLTARGAITELQYDGNSGSSSFANDLSKTQVRVVSVAQTEDAEPANERVSTRRVVVNRPIETLDEVNVVEPATKLERVAYQQPTFIKTARLDHVQVHGSVPVVGKALTPTVAHAAIPLFQKTISPGY